MGEQVTVSERERCSRVRWRLKKRMRRTFIEICTHTHTSSIYYANNNYTLCICDQREITSRWYTKLLQHLDSFFVIIIIQFDWRRNDDAMQIVMCNDWLLNIESEMRCLGVKHVNTEKQEGDANEALCCKKGYGIWMLLLFHTPYRRNL